MNFDAAKSIIVKHLQQQKKATNSNMIELIGGDKMLFEKIREELILDDIAEDKKGVGLIYIQKTNSESKQDVYEKTNLKLEEPINDVHDLKFTGEYKQQVFISYGRRDAFEFAQKLALDLEKKASRKVWLDMKSIESGDLFEVQIEEGIRSSSIVLAVMTTHSLRDESVCRDEVVFALNEGKQVVPITGLFYK